MAKTPAKKTTQAPQTSYAVYDPSGYGMSMAPEIAEQKGYTPVEVDTRTGKPVSKTPSQIPSVPTISSETKRYQEAGYTKSEATILAKESVKQGGMSFAPEYPSK